MLTHEEKPLFSPEFAEKLEKRKQIEDTPEVMELRRLRNEATEKAQEYQKQINEKIKALHQVPDIIGKFIKFADKNKFHYGLVSKVDRLFDGIRVYYDYAFDEQLFALGKIVTFSDSGKLCYSHIIYWDQLKDIKIITQEEFNSTLMDQVTNFIKTTTQKS